MCNSDKWAANLLCHLGCNDYSGECMTNWIEFDGLNFSGLV